MKFNEIWKYDEIFSQIADSNMIIETLAAKFGERTNRSQIDYQDHPSSNNHHDHQDNLTKTIIMNIISQARRCLPS